MPGLPKIPITKGQKPDVGFLGTLGSILGGPIGTLGGALLSGLIGRNSARDQNRQQIALAREQMAFQERMSNTAHQREVEDLRLAGLNPILSANKGASSPGGAMPTVVSPGERGLSSAFSAAAAKEAMQTAKTQRAVMDAQIERESATAFAATQQGNKTRIESMIMAPLAEIMSDEELGPILAIMDKAQGGVNSAVGVSMIIPRILKLFSKQGGKTAAGNARQAAASGRGALKIPPHMRGNIPPSVRPQTRP